MARALALLACAAAAAASHYAEYAGGSMPHYGGDYEAVGEHAPDYHGHSPDAPASLDYKYEEEQRSNANKPTKTVDEADVWRKVRRKQRGVQRAAGRDPLARAVGRFSDDGDDPPWDRASRVHARRRPKLRDTDDEPPPPPPPPPPRRPAKYSRDRNIQVSDMTDVDRDDYPEDKSKDFEERVKLSTIRVNRRKPRADFKKFDDDLLLDSDDTLVADRRMKPDEARTTYSPTAERDVWRFQPTRGRHRPVLDDARQADADDYNEYYDMKRVHSIKQNLPELLRRITTVKPSAKSSGETLRMPNSWANRRLGMAPSLTPRPLLAGAPSASSGDESDLDSGEIVDIGPLGAATISSTLAATATTGTHTVGASGATLTRTSTAALPANTSRELSLAEKSRLSILKKAQRKDGVKEESTKKPPVLLQVTEKLATLVMVEPPANRQPQRARLMSADSPQRLERVKKLMRHKLVAQANNIQELTDNWDDMVCDYIDVSLLDSGASPAHAAASALTLTTCLLFHLT